MNSIDHQSSKCPHKQHFTIAYRDGDEYRLWSCNECDNTWWEPN